MCIRSIFIYSVIICCIAEWTSFAQEKKAGENKVISAYPSFTLQFNINYNQSVLELSGTSTKIIRSEYIYIGETFGADKGYGVNAVSKLSIDNSGMFRFRQSVGFNRILTYAYRDNKSLPDIGEGNYNVFIGALGMDYNFTPVKRFSVYIGGEINASLINGDARVWFERRGNPLGDSLESYIFSSSFRIGYGINAGTEYLVNSGFGLNLGFKFSNLNAFTKKADGSNGESEFELRDDYKQGLIFSGNKNFSFFSIFGGVNIYFGVKELKQNL